MAKKKRKRQDSINISGGRVSGDLVEGDKNVRGDVTSVSSVGAGSRKAGLAMAFKLLLAAEKRWRRINAPHLVPLVQAGVSSRTDNGSLFSQEKDRQFTNCGSLGDARNICPRKND